MTTTRISKIARLPHPVREQLNHRLQNGEMSRTLLKWLNNEPETKTIMADLFGGKTITHQNISDWRRTGYQDWLLQQQRLQWFANLTEHETEIDKHDQCNDTFEAMSNYFIFELGQAITTLREIKNTHDRLNRLETLTREFARLQNAFNWSRRVQLEFAKINGPDKTDSSEASDHSPLEIETHDVSGERARPGRSETRPRVSPFGSTPSQDSNLLDPPEQEKLDTQNPKPETPPEPKRQGAGALQDAPRTPEAQDQRASVLDCGSPLPLSVAENVAAQSPVPNSDLRPPISEPKCQPIPAPAPTTPPILNSQTLNPLNSSTRHPHPHPPMRGRRFVCVEG